MIILCCLSYLTNMTRKSIVGNIYLVIMLVEYVVSMKVSFPTFNKNLAVINNIDIKRLNEHDKDDLVKLFKAVPMLMFKNQNLNPKDLYEFCKVFDSKYNDKVIHPF